MVLGVLGRGADSAVLIVYLRVVLLPQALFLPRFDPCATSTAVPRLLGRVAEGWRAAVLHATRQGLYVSASPARARKKRALETCTRAARNRCAPQ